MSHDVKRSLSKIKREAKFWRKAAEYLANNCEPIIECMRKYKSELLIENSDVKVIVPIIVTEENDFGVIYGCRVINILDFLTEISYVDSLNLWDKLIENDEAILVR